MAQWRASRRGVPPSRAGTIKAGSPAELVARWRSFLATAACGVYVARYRGEILGLEAADEAAYAALAA